LSYKVRVKERNLSSGRVSLEAASAIINVLRVAIRAQTAAIGVRKSQRGRIGKLARETAHISLVRIDEGSGIMVWESENLSLFDAPREAFDGLVREVLRHPEDLESSNGAMQKAILTLENAFRENSPIEFIEFVDGSGVSAKVDASTVYRLRLSISNGNAESVHTSDEITGRLMELDLSTRTFQVHEANGDTRTISYDTLLESVIQESLDRFVTARTAIAPTGLRSLLSLETVDEIPFSRFSQQSSLGQLIAEQNVLPISDFRLLEMDDPDLVSSAEFAEFLRSARRDS